MGRRQNLVLYNNYSEGGVNVLVISHSFMKENKWYMCIRICSGKNKHCMDKETAATTTTTSTTTKTLEKEKMCQ